MGKYNKSIGINTILEAAFLVLIAQNAILLAAPLISLLKGSPLTQIHLLLITLSLMNIMEIISNWNACTIYQETYSYLMLIFDALTLATFYLETYIFTELCKDGELLELKPALVIVSVAYAFVYLLYILWNCAAIQQDVGKTRKENIRVALTHDIVLLSIILLVILFSVLDLLTYAFILYCFYVIFCVSVWIQHSSA